MDRAELHQQLATILGSSYVYYQPPESIKLQFPCVIYELSSKIGNYANDRRYYTGTGYTLTLVTATIDDPRCSLLEQLKYCKFNRYYASEGLHHYVYTIYI